jgi:uncharacterized membrane protein YqhA
LRGHAPDACSLAVFRPLLRLRFLAAVAVLVFAVNAAGFIALGVARTVHACISIVRRHALPVIERPGIELAEAVDLMLFALVLIVLSLGTASLYLSGPNQEVRRDLPEWMRVKSLTELKLLLWEAILATLVVAAATGVVADLPHLEWRHLLLPGVILILSVSYFLLKHTEAKH